MPEEVLCVPSTDHGHTTKHPKALSQPAWDEPSGCLSGGFLWGCGEHGWPGCDNNQCGLSVGSRSS